MKGTIGFLRNKYLLAIILFVVWMMFFDEKDWGLIYTHKNKLNDLQKSEQQLGKMIKDTREELGLLKTNTQTIEKYAREQYLMKKDNEDLFIVNPDTNK